MNIDSFVVSFLGELNQYVTNFQWDVAKYPLIKQTTLRNLSEIIGKVRYFDVYLIFPVNLFHLFVLYVCFVRFPLSCFVVVKPVFHHSRNISLANNLISCSFVPSAKGQTEDENFQRLDQQNKFLQRRMSVKNDFYVKIFRWRRRNDRVETAYS